MSQTWDLLDQRPSYLQKAIQTSDVFTGRGAEAQRKRKERGASKLSQEGE